MYADDRVLVGVLKRKKDLQIAQQQHWYRIPARQLPLGLQAEYIALFLSACLQPTHGGSVAYFARVTGVELTRRSDLLPNERQRPQDLYYKVQFRHIIEKDPPILNVPARRFSFIRSTWDRFICAETISDLYSTDGIFVDRLERPHAGAAAPRANSLPLASSHKRSTWRSPLDMV